jgi:hypothetical protein
MFPDRKKETVGLGFPAFLVHVGKLLPRLPAIHHALETRKRNQVNEIEFALPGYEPEGWEFESLRARHAFSYTLQKQILRIVAAVKKGCTEPSHARFSAIVSIRPRSPILPV